MRKIKYRIDYKKFYLIIIFIFGLFINHNNDPNDKDKLG